MPASRQRAERAVFVADLHLGVEVGPRHLAFRDFLARLSAAARPPHLFILGDLFDYWAGRRSERLRANRFVLECLGRAARDGVPVSFVGGNRDFLFDDDVAFGYGLRILAESAPLVLGGRRVLVSHGDQFILGDLPHLRLRWFLRSALVREVVALAPPRVIDWGARQLRQRSRGRSAVPPSARERERFDVAPAAVARVFRGGYDVVVCGHVHQARRRYQCIDGRRAELFSLGAWEEEGCALLFEDGEFEFIRIPLEPRREEASAAARLRAP